MNDEQFEYQMCMIEHAYNPTVVAALRARDTAQREALARVEAELSEEAANSVVVSRDRDRWRSHSYSVAEQRDKARAHLAEAVGLLCKIAEWPNGGSQYGQENIKNAAKAFLARHAQAEQQEASEPVLARPEHGVSLDEAMTLTMDRYSGALDRLAIIEQQEAQVAQAGDERAVFCDAVREAAKEFLDTVDEEGLKRDAFGEFVHPEPKQLLRICQLYRAALATQPAVQWFPMEAAPKDRRILVLRVVQPGTGSSEAAIAQWNAQPYHVKPKPYWDIERDGLDIQTMRDRPPLGWMPLPEPDAVRGAEQ